MIVGIDGNEANQNERVGVHQYAFELLWGLYKKNLKVRGVNRLQDTKNSKISYRIYLKDNPLQDLPPENMHWKYEVIQGGRMWVLLKLMPYLLFKEKIDIFFTPSHYLPFFSRCPKVCTIHDLGYLKFSGQFKKYDYWQLMYWSAISIIISKYIICPSISTKKDIVRHYPFTQKKVHIIPHGYNKDKFNSQIDNNFVRRIINKYRITKDYILFLSTLKPSKNVEGLLNAFSYIKEKYDYQLVIAGKKGWLYKNIFKKVKDLELEKDVIFTNYIKEEEKPALLKGAKVFVLPSFWEGFGMDILNALACGTPVIASNVASLPEVGGESVLYINPLNPGDISKKIEKILDMKKKEYNILVSKGISHAKKFTWEKTALKTLEVFQKAVLG